MSFRSSRTGQGYLGRHARAVSAGITGPMAREQYREAMARIADEAHQREEDARRRAEFDNWVETMERDHGPEDEPDDGPGEHLLALDEDMTAEARREGN